VRGKPDRLAGGKLKDYKARGEWAELYFMMLAAGEGMKVSKPFGESGKYDVGVENQKRVLRVQVKSAAYAQRENEFCFNLMGPDPQQPKYPHGTVDFFAILLIPIDVWYIVPFDLIATTRSIYFSPRGARQKYGEYWEAWYLLKETGLVIQACVDEESPVTEARTTDSSLRSE
jgi:hypothetical protein